MINRRKIGVGIIGANSDKSWAAESHIPALRALPDRYEITALSTSKQHTADAAAQRFGVARAYGGHEGLVADDTVDLVVVTVKVPAHLELVTAAVAAGKAVYCEWPLGNGLAEAEQLARLARDVGVPGVIGLQGRAAPVVRHVRNLVRDGFIGDVRSTSLIASGGNWGKVVAQAGAYIADRANGATMLEINLGHSVDALCWCLGEFDELSAHMATLDPTIRIAETGEIVPMTAADQIVIGGTLENGAAASIHYRGGLSRGTNFHWEINGSEGDLVVTLDDPLGSLGTLKLLGSVGSVQLGALRLFASQGEAELAELDPPGSCVAEPGAPRGLPFNLTQAYFVLAEEMVAGRVGALTPTFDDALVRHRMMDAILRAADTGERASYPSPAILTEAV
jgi:predicted dehydrogenase